VERASGERWLLTAIGGRMERASGERWLLTAIGAIATITSTAFLVIRPLPLPDWVPGAGSVKGGARGTGDSLRPVPPLPFSVTPGDGQLTVSWPSKAGTDPYRADAVVEEDAPSVYPCRKVSRPTDATSTCVVSGLRNGASYLVSVHPADGADASVPTRTARAVPRPALLASPSVVAWLDASDYATIKPDHKGEVRIGSKVLELRDKSSHHYDAQQPEAELEPILGQLGKLPALLLDGNDVMFMDGAGFPTGASPSTVLVVASQDDRSGDVTCFHNLLSWGTNRTREARILHKGCLTSLAFAETFDTHNEQEPTQRWPIGQAALVTAAFDGTGTSLWLNRTRSYRWQSPLSERMNTANTGGVSIGGAMWDMRAGWVGRIGEVIVFDRLLTPGERKSIETYLGAKWQLLLDPRDDPA
jgi:hypothetical protein